MTNQLDTSTVAAHCERGVPEIVVSPEMVRAGLDELREHSYAGDTEYMLECVFRAMAYASFSASAISSDI